MVATPAIAPNISAALTKVLFYNDDFPPILNRHQISVYNDARLHHNNPGEEDYNAKKPGAAFQYWTLRQHNHKV